MAFLVHGHAAAVGHASSPLLLSDVRELDGLLDHVASRQGCPVTALGADLAMQGGEEPGVRIDIRERRSGKPLARGFYRLAPLGAEAGAYRVAVRLASAGVQLAAADETLARMVERAVTLTKEAPSSDAKSGYPVAGLNKIFAQFSARLGILPDLQRAGRDTPAWLISSKGAVISPSVGRFRFS
jgi:hypothetical protein